MPDRAGRGGALVPVAVVLVLAGVVLATFPGAVGLSMTAPFAQVVAMRGLAAVLLLVVVLPPAVALLIRSVRRHHRLRTVVSAVLVAACIGAALYDVATLDRRGLDRTRALPVPEIGLEPTTDQIRLVAYNTLRADTEDITDLVVRHHANVVVLPETSLTRGHEVAEAAAAELSARVAVDGLHPALGVSAFQVFSSGTVHGYPAGFNGTTVLLVADELGTYRQDLGADLNRGDIRAVPDDPADPVLYGVSAFAPVNGLMPDWRESVGRAAAYCDAELPPAGPSSPARGSEVGAIVAGDFNATADHAAMELKRCGSALANTRVTGELAGEGTWPAFLPPVLGAAIDHVVVPTAHWSTFSARIETVPGSDHRALATVLLPLSGTDPVEGAPS